MGSAIGIFDSGLGGLTVFRAIKSLMPSESLVYLGDTARVPYGSRSREVVIRYSLENAKFLVEMGVKAIVVACNTSSAYALEAIEDEFDVPVFGVIKPAVRAALRATRCGCVGVIGTEATIASGAYDREIRSIDKDVRVVSAACPLFVPLVEEGWLEGDVVYGIVKRYLQCVLSEGVDVLVLGCTHYPLLKRVIQKISGDDVKLVDSADECALELKQYLQNRGVLSCTDRCADDAVYVTDFPVNFEKVARRFMGDDLGRVEKVAFEQRV